MWAGPPATSPLTSILTPFPKPFPRERKRLCYDPSAMLRRLLIAILVLALPVQGAFASSRWLCAAVSHDAPKSVAVHDHANPGASHEHGAAHDHGAKHDQNKGHGGGDGSCNLCAACTVTVATPPVLITFAAVDTSTARFPSFDAAAPAFGTGGPERPPRTI